MCAYCTLQDKDRRLPTADCGLRTADCRLLLPPLLLLLLHVSDDAAAVSMASTDSPAHWAFSSPSSLSAVGWSRREWYRYSVHPDNKDTGEDAVCTHWCIWLVPTSNFLTTPPFFIYIPLLFATFLLRGGSWHQGRRVAWPWPIMAQSASVARRLTTAQKAASRHGIPPFLSPPRPDVIVSVLCMCGEK